MGLLGTSIRIPADLLEEIDKLAAREERSRSNMILKLVKEALEARKVKAAHAVAHRE